MASTGVEHKATRTSANKLCVRMYHVNVVNEKEEIDEAYLCYAPGQRLSSLLCWLEHQLE